MEEVEESHTQPSGGVGSICRRLGPGRSGSQIKSGSEARDPAGGLTEHREVLEETSFSHDRSKNQQPA
jgi:hypothetical protein